MSDCTIWHNPRCSKSREALSLLESKGTDAVVFKYLQQKITAKMIEELLEKLGISAKELLRTKEEEYTSLGLKDEKDEKKLIQAMAEHPKLIERPIVIKGKKAVLGRPPEKVLELL